MQTATIYRYNTDDQGTDGVIVTDSGWWCYTLELPQRNNQSNRSCIPSGEYEVTRRYSPHFGRDTYWLKDVDGREYILIHSANFAGDVELGYQSHLNGCIALGKVKARAKNKYGKIQKCISRSKEAIRDFEELLNCEDFKIIIKDTYVDNIT